MNGDSFWPVDWSLASTIDGSLLGSFESFWDDPFVWISEIYEFSWSITIGLIEEEISVDDLSSTSLFPLTVLFSVYSKFFSNSWF